MRSPPSSLLVLGRANIYHLALFTDLRSDSNPGRIGSSSFDTPGPIRLLESVKPMIHGPTCRKRHVGYDKICGCLIVYLPLKHHSTPSYTTNRTVYHRLYGVIHDQTSADFVVSNMSFATSRTVYHMLYGTRGIGKGPSKLCTKMTKISVFTSDRRKPMERFVKAHLFHYTVY